MNRYQRRRQIVNSYDLASRAERDEEPEVSIGPEARQPVEPPAPPSSLNPKHEGRRGYDEGMSQAEYLAQLEAARWTECANCKGKTLRRGQWFTPDCEDYCGEMCANAGARRQAPMNHLRATNAKTIEGWDV